MSRTLVVVGWLFAACGDGVNPLAPVPRDVLRAPERATVGDVTVRLETYLYRDFAPSSPPDGKPLIAGLRVSSVNGGALPSWLGADSVWVLNSAAVWVAKVVQEQPRSDPSYVDVVAREGPKWGPGIEVDVVVQLHDAGGNRVFLRARAQSIHRTD